MDALVARAVRDGGAETAAPGVAAVGGALAATEFGLERLTSSEDPRRFRLPDGERVPDGLRRIACGQLDLSLAGRY